MLPLDFVSNFAPIVVVIMVTSRTQKKTEGFFETIFSSREENNLIFAMKNKSEVIEINFQFAYTSYLLIY